MTHDQNQLDISFGRFLASRSNESSDLLFKAGRAVSLARREGNVCALLQAIDSSMDSDELKTALLETKVVGLAGEYCPLIIHGDFLYLHRYFKFETSVANYINDASMDTSCLAKAQAILEPLFPKIDDGVDYQKNAAMASICHTFSVISGGPGTGKTTTVAKILALHIGLNPDIRIMLAAPTGKAATRLEQSLRDTCATIDLEQPVKDKINQPVQTIHRLLGFSRSGFRHNVDNPLPADLVLVDEASMVDLPLMADLMLALPRECRLILLGDQYQLASVQPGAVLGEICSGHKDNTAKIGAIVTLEKSFRFKEDSGIRLLADFIKMGDGKSALQVLQDDQYADVTIKSANTAEIITAIHKAYKGEGPDELLTGFNKLGVLCCHRTGPLGVEDMNEQAMATHKLAGGDYYHGLPLMILANDHALGLYNGDTCVVVEENKRLYGCFKTTDGLRMILIRKLPTHAPAYGITVHKSQGSEYANVVFILPTGASKVLGRELVYTAVTRARKKVTVHGDPELFVDAVNRRVARVSGLECRI